ncbi:hypothetical protein MOQ_004931 [Trypanosoma cruzi marinkellei]|uniref:Uncharacterized protein n=1 Tax=Trypanosoma cruzi marinkellei TaxID=85056 RepID=K2MVV4_TRYCR|nr:hypothetical protein MOQ_004931 [Trypanosoma cruzi marinkellei]
MATVRDSVLFYAKVEKIGTDDTILSRNVFLTPSALLVCLPAGGITRTVSLANITEIEVSRQELVGKPSCRINVRGEVPINLRFADQSVADDFLDAVSKTAINVRVVNVAVAPVQGEKKRLDMSHAAPKGVRFATSQEQPESSFSSLAAGNDKWRRLSSPSSSVGPPSRASAHTVAKPVEALEFTRPTSAVGLKANGERDSNRNSVIPLENHVSPFRREVFHYPHAMGSADGKASNSAGVYDLGHLTPGSLYTTDITRPVTTLGSPTSGQPFQLQERYGETLVDLCAQRDSVANMQQRFSTDLELQKQTVSRLTGELHEKNAFIDDLKTALRSQEGLFQEMLVSTEQLRLMEKTKSQLEEQVNVLQTEVKCLENLTKQKESDHRKELAAKLAELHEAHTKEMEELREAFAQYDAEMTEYVSGLLKERDREARKGEEQERRLQKQIESQRHEIAELKGALAPRQAVLSGVVASYYSADPTVAAAASDEAKEEAGRAAVVGGADGLNGNLTASASHHERELPQSSRWPTSHAVTMPQLEIRLALLEEERARLRLREKLRHHSRRRE